jgi:hypothetical protein
MTRRTSGHPDWCAQGHRCGLGEHRAEPIAIHTPGRGRLVLTRVAANDGQQHAEVTVRLYLSDHEAIATQQLLILTKQLLSLLAAVPTTRRNHNGASS